MKPWTLTAVLATVVAMTVAAAAQDANLPPYQLASGISGQLKSVGSDTLGNQMEAWAKGFIGLYPGVKIDVDAKGSATAPPTLLDGSAQLGPMSRFMTEEEAVAFEKKYGYRAIGIRVAADAVAVYVNKDNPIRCLTFEQVDQIFSSTRWGSGGKSINTWGDVGLTGEWAARSITLFGRNTISGTYEFFREAVLYGGDFKNKVRLEPGSEAVVADVAGDKFGIGYSGIGFKTDGVRAVPLAAYGAQPCYEPSSEATFAGQYGLARYLLIYLNKEPNQPLDALRAEFVKYILSKDGQELTKKAGFYPITGEIRDAELKKLGIGPGG